MKNNTNARRPFMTGTTSLRPGHDPCSRAFHHARARHGKKQPQRTSCNCRKGHQQVSRFTGKQSRGGRVDWQALLC
eukprot:2888566-Alexandrium_andersonii.AAC.1